LPASTSLVKYGHAVLVLLLYSLFKKTISKKVSTSGKRALPKDGKEKKDAGFVPTDKNLTNAHTEDILNSILPPRFVL